MEDTSCPKGACRKGENTLVSFYYAARVDGKIYRWPHWHCVCCGSHRMDEGVEVALSEVPEEEVGAIRRALQRVAEGPTEIF